MATTLTHNPEAATTNTTTPWRPKAIVFDLLTALLDSWSLWDASTPSGTPEEGHRWRVRYLEITFGAGAYVPYEDLVRQSARDVGLPDSAPRNLLDSWDVGLKAWPEVADVLQRLKAKGYVLGVLTNCSVDLGHAAARQAEVGILSQSGGGSVFDKVITAEESGFYKPRKEAYQAIMTAMALTPEQILFVAGSAGDVEGATNAGMKVVWHNRVGLAKKGHAVPLKEAANLDAALEGFL
ncbi:2-deoxyglucose-6-phosphate phosphatase [Microdochium trichocladiopsis]|uniref:2-deoxyglucose-6-phosphate phosphatase n=1 Tax=Microdochium trichocladiopsis TaxID=1682393 RepID=A0A9P8XXY4_9PEZI|nr:2-deoxyglucose-6-phosphate phosphatase [Microdochium trichocladiopsis]KAH7024620.1 2-deoxyglucose-6-phosphate phosphatase [Microdochium trichocladiopsis]